MADPETMYRSSYHPQHSRPQKQRTLRPSKSPKPSVPTKRNAQAKSLVPARPSPPQRAPDDGFSPNPFHKLPFEVSGIGHTMLF